MRSVRLVQMASKRKPCPNSHLNGLRSQQCSYQIHQRLISNANDVVSIVRHGLKSAGSAEIVLESLKCFQVCRIIPDDYRHSDLVFLQLTSMNSPS